MDSDARQKILIERAHFTNKASAIVLHCDKDYEVPESTLSEIDMGLIKNYLQTIMRVIRRQASRNIDS